MSPLLLLAVPEAETLAGDDLVARVQAVANDLAREQPVEWGADLDRGGGPCLALGAALAVTLPGTVHEEPLRRRALASVIEIEPNAGVTKTSM